jgi:FHS family L-fucose permease-like MFS transporter
VSPPIMGAVVDAKGAHFALIVSAMEYVLAWTFPVYVNFWNWRLMDSHRETMVNVEKMAGKDLELEKGEEHHVEEVR